ncbi:hypothetical protein S7711_08852 [Stachybotrys chartarum IBT 7711]|uniref:Guanine nucleotide-exchange factor SEC12 n=1 Tax=Stachybotrys chartarum (strain CBS 109288 / IBT 7711) TaxID=1280523 RepID=A0A084AHR6_STACB|nr:hypothetical protein S7711_08852 [Stachybotrys chartarum IBT 7711]
MAPPFPRASLELNYPLYALDFDPEDASRLFVGGGGGPGNSGVTNKITLLETSTQTELRVAGELDFTRNEDSVMSLAVGGHKGKSTYVYAGVNSGPESIAKGKNEHMRTLLAEQSKSRSSVGTKTPEVKIAELSRTAMFSDPDTNTYQRLLRVAGSVGVAATGMGKDPQLAVFDTSTTPPKPRGVLELPVDAEDLDVVQTADDGFLVGWCYKYELHLVRVGKDNTDPEVVFTMPDDSGDRPRFRFIRFLSPTFILAAANLPQRSGIVLHGLRLPEPGQESARLAVTARIPRKISAAALAVANLSLPTSPGASLGNAQFVIAVAGNDSSISLYTVNHKPATKIDLLAELHPLCTLKNVQGSNSITGLAFSTFVQPKTHLRPQHLKLASISLEGTVSVHSIPLKKSIESTPRNKKGPPRPIRYVVAMQSHNPATRSVIIILTIMVLVMAIIGQSLMEVYGNSRPILGITRLVPSWHGTLRSFDPPPAGLLKEEFLRKLSGDNQPADGATLVMWEAEDQVTAAVGDAVLPKKINLDVHDKHVHGPGKTWDELEHEQREAWKGKLKEAGAWTQGMGESVFKGILFGEIAGAVGRAMGG